MRLLTCDGRANRQVVVGAGQAGLATRYFLTERSREHVVLERGRVGETWRSERWDGFSLNTPNWSLQLPGYVYAGPDPDAFAPLEEAIRYVEGYAGSFGAPVREGVTVTGLRHGGEDELVLQTRTVAPRPERRRRDGRLPATDALRPGRRDRRRLQLHTSRYRRPDELPDGVLVVGSGQSGCQVADELLQAGPEVYVSVGRCPWFPRRYRGADILHWTVAIGLMDETVDSLQSPQARLACNPGVSGNDGGHDCHPRWLAERGATLLARVGRIDGSRVSLEPGLDDNLRAGYGFVASSTG